MNYREYINAIPAYSYVVEESEVIDPSSYNKKVYSTQLFAHKENSLLKNNKNDEGWKIITPKKAIQDPRTFQNFNWRLLAKINYNFSKNKDIRDNSERATLKVAVLYSGIIDNIENPYVFANLEESVINQQNFLFENPLAPQNTTKQQRSYWALDVDNFIVNYVNTASADAFAYDFLVWTPNSPITEHQKRTIDMFLSNGISVFIDCSALDQTSLSSSGLSNFDFTLTTISNNTGLIKIVNEYLEGDQTLNAWDMNQYSESSIRNFGVFGDRKNIFNQNAVNPIRVFNGMPESQDGSAMSIVYLQDGTRQYSAILKDKYRSSSEFSSFAVFCANPFLTFLNDNYGGSGLPVSGKNKGATNSFPVGRAGSQTGLLSESVIGPNKLFYNILCESNRNKVNDREQYANDSVIVWNVSPWRNSWTINGKRDSSGKVSVLFEDEIKTFNFAFKTPELTSVQSSTTQSPSVFCRQINSSIGTLLLQDFEATSNQTDAATMINADFSNVEFYIECTNDNVNFLNFSKIDNSNYLFGNTKTSYSIHKLSTQGQTKVANSHLSLDAHSSVFSKEFDLASIYYPYVVLDYSDYVSQVNSVIKTPTEYLPGSQFVRDYDYAFSTQVFVTEVKTNRYEYEVNWSSPFEVDLEGTSGSITVTTRREIAREPDGTSSGEYGAYSGDWEKYPPVPITNNESPFHRYRYPTNIFSVTDILYRKFDNRSHTRNNFHYTNDLPITEYWDEYMLGKSGQRNDSSSPSQDNPGNFSGGGGGGENQSLVNDDTSSTSSGYDTSVKITTQVSNAKKETIKKTIQLPNPGEYGTYDYLKMANDTQVYHFQNQITKYNKVLTLIKAFEEHLLLSTNILTANGISSVSKTINGLFETAQVPKRN